MYYIRMSQLLVSLPIVTLQASAISPKPLDVEADELVQLPAEHMASESAAEEVAAPFVSESESSAHSFALEPSTFSPALHVLIAREQSKLAELAVRELLLCIY